MRVLTHTVDCFSLEAEPVATQALAHVLNSSGDIRGAFVDGLMPGNGFRPGPIQAELGNEGGQPDLTIRDNQGELRAFVENKFWAGLTENQPVNYLDPLPEGGTLLFIVPKLRVHVVWNEIVQRCRAAGHEPQEDGHTRCADVLGKTMMITSWKHVLTVLMNAAQDGNHRDVQCDILQLQDLARRQDSEAFLPVRPDELTDQEMARRLVNYSDLIELITNQLVTHNNANTQGLRPAHSWHTAGRFLRVFRAEHVDEPDHQYGVWLGVNLDLWRTFGITPLWLRLDLNYREFANVNGDAGEIQARCIGQGFQVQDVNGALYFPVRIEHGVERDHVIGEAVRQITEIPNILDDPGHPE
ncbi:MAG: hypothetical protein OXS40_12500 [Gammaproteobacteria bacterium]|nr:hypothetical protein [Gammaproteobacteria bacterium]